MWKLKLQQTNEYNKKKQETYRHKLVVTSGEGEGHSGVGK